MNLIYIVMTLLLLLLNLAGITLLVSHYVPPFAIARSVGILLFCLTLFFIEHFIGLGRLTWAWPLTSVISAFVIYQQRDKMFATGFYKAEAVFYLAFLYVFAWKFAFPSIYPSSEHVTDLYFIANYLDGTTLPPLDHWYPPHVFNVYYAFQHYAAALMGRIFGLNPGTTYSIAFALLLALPATLAWELAGRYVQQNWAKGLLVVVLVSGGTGISPLIHLLQQPKADLPADQKANTVSDHIVTSQRFIGLMEKGNNTPLAEFLFPRLTPEQKPTPNFEPRELPMESYGYQIFLGDYHPPLGGFFLLLLALALVAAIEAHALDRLGHALLAATIPLVMVTNTWVLPLQGMLLMSWVGYRYWQKNPPNWLWMLSGGLLTCALIYPFLSEFALHAQNTPIRFTAAIDHTPLGRFIALHWPLLVLILLALFEPRTRKLSVTLALTFGVMLLLSEFVYVDDPTGDKYQRTNSTMKWWGWIWCGGVASLGALCLGSSARAVRWGAVITLLLVSVYSVDLARYYYLAGKGDRGYLSGHHWLTQDQTNKAMINYLIDAPNGIVLENQYDNAYSNTSLYALFTGKPALLGWPLHLVTWRGDVPDVWLLKDQVTAFYSGKLPNSLDWLLVNRVRYVVWSAEENSKQPTAFGPITQQISSRYVWKEFYVAGDYRVGIWVQRP
jgi:uncharacterized membrane protein